MNEQIRNWKKLYGKIFATKIEGKEYIYRSLNIGEICSILTSIQQGQNTEAEDIALKAVLYPLDFDSDESILLSQTLANFIIESSQVLNPREIKNIIEDSRKRISLLLQNDFFQWKLCIMKVFPGYTLFDLDKLSASDFFDVLVLAEELTKEKLINDDRIEENANKLNDLPKDEHGDLITTGNKFLSKRELELISADKATKNLRQHYMKYKNRG